MATTQTEVESQTIELSREAFDAFCDSISGMFDVGMECKQQEAATKTVVDLKKSFKKKLTAVNIVRSEGALQGNFQLVFDQGGLFTLSSVIIMLPENRILEEIQRGTIKDVESMNDAVKEAGKWSLKGKDYIIEDGDIVLFRFNV